MIHFRRPLDEITPVAPPGSEPPVASLPFRRPADYYSSPVSEGRPLFPRWVPFGCGAAAIVLLILVFAGGIVAARGGLGDLFDLMFASIQGEVDKMLAPDVKPAQKVEFDAEMKKMRDAVRENRLSIDRLQPLLRSIRDVSGDERVTSKEIERLTKEVREINSVPKKK